MNTFIINIREGYFFAISKIRSREDALYQIKNIFPVIFIGYYISILAVIAWIFYITEMSFFLNRINKILLGVLLLSPYLFFSFSKLAKYRNLPINENQPEEIKLKKTRLFIYVFIGSFASLFLVAILLSTLQKALIK